ncbi:hypothetical protein ACN6LA_001042, partial [Streptomyces sp. SAS_269]|uniref:hypothetical protein n=1 Tax=Streptomyces sp. SAS_269 TaxID=3412749 RepID=UPI00403CA80F
TVAANLKHYLPEYRTIVPERLIGYGRAAQSVKKTRSSSGVWDMREMIRGFESDPVLFTAEMGSSR